MIQMEMEHWWKRNEPAKLESDMRNIVEDLTGCIPLLLDSCIVNGKIDLFAEPLQAVFNQVRRFIKTIDEHENEIAWRM
jgi:hypothetical protein